MEIRLVPFEKIDKNKWNGSIHYAHNGNVFGYYWYLKSVLKEWDALIEDDYISVMPVPRYEWSAFQLSLLHNLGPYSVHKLSDERINAFIDFWHKHCLDFSYNFNHRISQKSIKNFNLSFSPKSYYHINLSNSYESIYAQYSSEFNQIFAGNDLANYEFGSQEKPEDFLRKTNISQEDKAVLYRLFYNAIQRGLGWHARVNNIKTKKPTSAFFISDAGNIHLIFSAPTDVVANLLLIDTFIQSNAGKPGFFNIGFDEKMAELFGAESSQIIHYKGDFTGLSGTVKRLISRFF